MAKKRRSTGTARIVFISVLIVLMLLMIAGTALLIRMCIEMPNQPVESGMHNNSFVDMIFGYLNQSDLIPTETTPPARPADVPTTAPTTEPETEPPTTLPDPEHVVSTATIVSTGDMLMHITLVDSARQKDGSYDFSGMFRYLNEYTEAADYAVANLETTLCGTDNGYKYNGYPAFNTPDEIAEDLKNAGFDMLLTANNHSYDTSLVGYKRTLEVVRDTGMATLGTNLTAEEPKYVVQDINGIKIGMICYTYATSVTSDGRPALNGNAAMSEAGICNYFTYNALDKFYTELGTYMGEMKAQGAEATVVYLHWGEENHLKPMDYQKTMAQKLCDMGVDVIVGGHPHVVEPIELLSSTEDPDHKMVVLYSMGNAVSNQRQGNLQSIKTAHTEDGVLFGITFSKYSDDTVYLESIDLIPCWVNMPTNNGRQYIILPLDDATRDQWKEKYELTDASLGAAERSYDRTMEIVGEGLAASQTYLAEAKEQREANYLEAVQLLAAA